MLQTIADFTRYFEGIRRRTINYVKAIPEAGIDWAPEAGELSCAEIVRHLAAAEQMFIGAAVLGRWHYRGHEQPALSNSTALVEHLDAAHRAGLALLDSADDSLLGAERPTLDGPPVKGWRLLMALVEHEIHHRSQLASYLRMQGVTPPHLYGLGVEDVIARATE